MLKNISQLQYINQLDGFRFFAIASVMLAHFITNEFISRFPFGFGVLFFFVLSSFLITRILLNAKKNNEEKELSNFYSLKHFYIRRSLRIFPIYYVLIIFLLIVNFSPCREIFPYLFTYTVNLFISYSHNTSIAGGFSHLWSLSIEEQFYILFPFFIFTIKKKHILFFLISVTLIGLTGRMLLFLYNPSNIALWNFHSISALDSLGIGAILGYLSLYKLDFLKKIIGNRYLFFLAAFLFLSTMIFSFTIYTDNLRYNFYSAVLMRFFLNILSFWILGWAVVIGYKGVIKQILENRFIVYLGKISYGLYLYHYFVMSIGNFLLHKYNLHHSMEKKALAYTLISVLIASLSWHLFESPINKLKNNFKYIQ